MEFIIGLIVGAITGGLQIGTMAYKAGLKGDKFLIWKPFPGAKK